MSLVLSLVGLALTSWAVVTPGPQITAALVGVALAVLGVFLTVWRGR